MDIPAFIYYHCIFPVKKILKNIRYNLYYKNWKERNKNIQLLKNARKNKVLNKEKPLISITIPTYNKGQILVNRTIPSVLNQTYPHFEVIIIGIIVQMTLKVLFNKLRMKEYDFLIYRKEGIILKILRTDGELQEQPPGIRHWNWQRGNGSPLLMTTMYFLLIIWNSY